MAVKLVQISNEKHSPRPFCVLKGKRWGTEAGDHGLADFYITTVCSAERQWWPSKHRPLIVVDYDTKIHLNKVCEACVKLIRQARPKKAPTITVVRGLDR